ncbi:hypothetical protein DWG18_09675 [Lysobacter sp. TY2-98]|uniref:hypothetical protein n=1 Tax=Lysobacter sp. TY2-98 TaxID=2290922 RepID=UPI000E201C87|nr:hypothetical protein [Lysobacter sp. TY2-98]AXK72513.1 hypothetical protein DWG18_09675 [Lysobacter sp. TY2-98]
MWLIAIDAAGALCVLAGLLIHTGAIDLPGIPPGTHLLLFALGGLAMLGTAIQIMRFVRTANASKSSR